VTRRHFLGRLAIGAAGCSLGLRSRASAAANGAGARTKDELRLAFFGVGGRGNANVANLADHRVVAFAEVDEERGQQVLASHPKVPRYRDYRRLLDRHADEIDGIVISTPDHWHRDMGLAAIAAGKHVFMEKPLAPTIEECRELRHAAEASRVITQFGAQGHAFEALRVLREWIDAGAVGRVSRVVTWTDRMRPQDFVAADEPMPGQPVPPTLDWEGWLGQREFRPYHPAYVPNRWRNWWDFGAGAVTDIGVHMFDVLTFALDIGYPDLVVARSAPRRALTAPEWSEVTWTFPRGDGGSPLQVSWTGGHERGQPVKPTDVPRLPPEVVSATPTGMAFVGPEGTLFIPDMRASSRPRIYPESREREVLASRPARTLPRPKGGHWKDWTDAIFEGRAAGTPIAYGAELTEKVLLGALAQRTEAPIRWVPQQKRFIDNPAAAALLAPRLRAE
jgi:predicted dehydrogenase